MNTKTSQGDQRPDPAKKDSKDSAPKPGAGTGTEAERAGGIEPAKRQAERDWEDSAKESGD